MKDQIKLIEAHTEAIRQARLELEATRPDPKLGMAEMPYEAAKMVEVVRIEDEVYYPGNRTMQEISYPGPLEDTIEIDITDAVCADMVDMGSGTHTHYNDFGDVEVRTDAPSIYIVDADGVLIEGARIMVEYSNVTVDTV
ncbi:hypothetical protein N9878_02240 [bacterium]|nr:hypothetical protein [bacterium]